MGENYRENVAKNTLQNFSKEEAGKRRILSTNKERRHSMSKEEKKKRIELMAKKFMQIESPVGKGYAIMCMTAYEEGKEAGRAEERERQTTVAM